MSRFITKHLVVVAAIIAIVAPLGQAQAVEQIQDAGIAGGLVPMQPAPLKGRSIFDEYTLGQQVDGAKIMYTYQYTQSFDTVQSEITLDYDFPAENDNADNSNVITLITLYVEAADNATTQAYVTQGGIGANSVSLQIVAQNSDSLRYMVIIYGKQP